MMLACRMETFIAKAISNTISLPPSYANRPTADAPALAS
jgi:hypothetical protein